MTYSIKEIIDIALGLEEAGYEFYTQCGLKFKEAHIQEVFLFLAREELEHKKTFESIKTGEEPPQGIFTEEYYLYLKSIGGGRVFEFKNRNIDQIMDTINTPEDAVTKAFMDEKESILFYSEIKTLYRDDRKTLEILDKIIEEERKHVLTLADLLAKMNLAS